MTETLRDLVAAELAEAVDPRVAAIAGAIAGLYPGAARAVLFYGSCLREHRLDGLMLDFYLIVSDYRAAYGRSWLAAANRLIPPNVFPFEHEGLAAKYAMLSEADFARECGRDARSVSVWARFAQPSRLAWAADETARAKAIASVAEAGPTLFALARPLVSYVLRDDPLAVFRAGFALTYGAELRAERRQRSGAIVDADPERYRRFGDAILARGSEAGESPRAAGRAWRWRRRKGKALTLLRLAKASFTFAGGVDYLAWKINRHAGTKIVIKPWQRRWPLLAAFTLLPRLLRRGAIR
ncbi:MAG TPA: hypothetical protein VFW19_05505 [Allosphingosinicella sp.]|nr:hypothetical protein [Allosphingosinicella sp.]